MITEKMMLMILYYIKQQPTPCLCQPRNEWVGMFFYGEYNNDGDDFVLHEQVMSHPSPPSQPKRKKVGMMMVMMMMTLYCISRQWPVPYLQERERMIVENMMIMEKRIMILYCINRK